MRVIRISLALWWDPHWGAAFRRSWKRRRYWLAKPKQEKIRGRVLAVQLGPITVKIRAEGKDNG